MFKTGQSNQTAMSRKTSSNIASARAQIQLPCPTHPAYIISHVCLSPSCQLPNQFCSECLFEQSQQQHIAKHKEHVIGWVDFIALCRRMSVSGRLGDALGDSSHSKDVMSLVLQTQIHQQQFKTHLRNQEQLINQDFDKLIQQLTQDVNKLKSDMICIFKNYQQELMDLGKVVEKMIQEYYQHKGELKDYNNDFDNFLKDIIKLQDQIAQQEAKQVRQSLNSPQTQTVCFNLKKLMQNIIPLLSRANSTFQKTLQTQTDGVDNQSSATGLSLFSSFSIKNNDNSMINDIIQEYKTLLDNRPSYKNQGLAQQVYSQCQEQLQKMYHSLSETIQHFVTPQFKSLFKNIKVANKENSDTTMVMKTRPLNSPARGTSQPQNQFLTQTITSCKKISTEKSSQYIDNYLKQQQTKQLKSLTFKDDAGFEEDYQEQVAKQSFLKQTNQGCVQLEGSVEYCSLDHKRTVQTSHKGGINCIQMVDEDFIATGSNDKSLKIWKLGSYELVKTVQFNSDVTSLATLLRPDGSSMLVVGLYRSICLLNQSYEVIKYFESQPSYIDKDSQLKVVTLNLNDNSNQLVQQVLHNGQINAILPAQDFQSVLTCSQGDNKIIQWNLMDSSVLPKKYFDHRDQVTCLCHVNTETQMASAGKDRTIRIYNMIYHEKDFKNGSLEKLNLVITINDAHPTEITALNCTPQPNATLLSTCSTGELKIWDAQDGSHLRTIKNYCGWGYKIMFLYTNPPNKDALTQICQKSNQNRRMGSPTRSKVPQKILPELFKQSHMITFSFDGTMKVYDCATFINESPQSNYEPKFQVQTKSLLDCHPFGGALLLRDQVTDKVEILTTGNKNDMMIQVYGLKEV